MADLAVSMVEKNSFGESEAAGGEQPHGKVTRERLMRI